MTVPELQTLAQLFIGRVLNTAVEGVVIAGLVWMLLRLIGRQNSGTRFAIWFSALLAIVALPFFAGSGFVTHSPVLPAASLHREITLSSSWVFFLFGAWMVGAGLLLLRLGLGLWRVRQVRTDCSDVDLAALDPAIARILRDFASRRRVTLCVSGEVAVPAAIGFFRRAIVFPELLLPQLSAREIEVILLHEFAHLSRWDDWTNLVQKTIKAVLFFHPAVWWIENTLTLEREMACDDMVLAQTASPRAYASSLISFAEKLHGARVLALAQALMSRMHQMSLRVARILDAKRPSRTGVWKPVLVLSASLLALFVGAVSYVPRIVAFQTQPATQHIQATQRTVDAEAQPEVAHAMSESVGAPVAQRLRLAPEARAIPATFNPRTAVLPTRCKVRAPRKPVVRTARATQGQLPIRETIVILQTRYDSGSGVWTFCVWKVGNGMAERQMESAIVVSSI